MTVTCPHCGSRNIRYSNLRSASEKAASLMGIRPLRCRDCRERFVGRIWSLSELPYARCPKCLRTDLAWWSPSHYYVPFGRGFLLFFGAQPYRCEYCRHNFVSFRRLKHKFVSQRRRTAAEAEEPASADSESGVEQTSQ